MAFPKPKPTLEELFLAQCIEQGIAPEAREYVAIPRRRFRWDYAWPTLKILVEIQGGVFLRGRSGHTSAAGVRRDATKNNLAVLYGYLPFQFTTDLVRNGSAVRFMKGLIDGDIQSASLALRPTPKRRRK